MSSANKPNWAVIIVAVNLLVLLLLAVLMPRQMISPGKVIDAHVEFAEDCFACHTPFIGSTPAKCQACHKVDDIGLRTSKGVPISGEKKNVAFHQSLIEEDCVACHSDHKGVQAFRPIGRFSHELLAQNVQKQCDSCHQNPGDALHRQIKGNCSACHTQDAWLPATFDHDKYFRFDRHHTTECTTCHIDSLYEQYTCYGCHEHSRSKVREEHLEEGIYEYENCTECHRSGDEDEAEYIWKQRRAKEGGYRGKYEDLRRRYREHDDDDD